MCIISSLRESKVKKSQVNWKSGSRRLFRKFRILEMIREENNLCIISLKRKIKGKKRQR